MKAQQALHMHAAPTACLQSHFDGKFSLGQMVCQLIFLRSYAGILARLNPLHAVLLLDTSSIRIWHIIHFGNQQNDICPLTCFHFRRFVVFCPHTDTSASFQHATDIACCMLNVVIHVRARGRLWIQ